MVDGTNTDHQKETLSQLLSNLTAGTDDQGLMAITAVFIQSLCNENADTDIQGLQAIFPAIDKVCLLFFQLFDETQYKLHVGGTVLSIIFLVLKFLVYFAVPNDLRRLPYKLVHHLSWTLLMSQIVLLISMVVISPQSLLQANEISIGLSVVLHFSVLSVFFFMNALVFNLFRSSSSTTDGGQSSQLKYCLYAYGIPACIVLGALILQWTLPESSTFRPNYKLLFSCWLCNAGGLAVFLVLPLGILLVANILLFFLTALKSTFRPCCNQRNLHQPKTYDEYMNQTTEYDGCCYRFIQYFLLNALVSATWICFLLQRYDYHFVVFFILTTLLGPFVFFAFTPFRKLSCRQTAEDDLYALIPKTTKA